MIYILVHTYIYPCIVVIFLFVVLHYQLMRFTMKGKTVSFASIEEILSYILALWSSKSCHRIDISVLHLLCFLKLEIDLHFLTTFLVCCYTVFLLNPKFFADLYSPIQGSGTREAPGLEPEAWVMGHKLPRTDRGQWILQRKEHTRSRHYCNHSWGQYANKNLHSVPSTQNSNHFFHLFEC